MCIRSQPIDDSLVKKLKLDESETISITDEDIKSQRMGKMFDDIFEIERKQTDNLKRWLRWKWQSVKNLKYYIKYALRNHIKWHKTLCEIRPWEGFSGLLHVMQTHLEDYVQCEEKYGTAAKDYKEMKISSVHATLELLERMNEPDDYYFIRKEEVDKRYPDYKYLITEYDRSTSYSGDFISFGNGWVGMESGKDPREGYFEFVCGKLELVKSPDCFETDRLLNEVKNYHEDTLDAYKQAELASKNDFEALHILMKDNLYSWWD
jgi:hypothetical protein